MAKKNKKENELPFDKKLILNQYILQKFGFATFEKLAEQLNNPELSKVTSDGNTGYCIQLSESRNLSDYLSVALEQYDLNIIAYVEKINQKRIDKVTLKYFQYVSLLFVEYYLDMFFNHKQILLNELNDKVKSFRSENPDIEIGDYQETDLNKLALWNATGSGKTLLMHINYYQYIHYSQGHKKLEDSSFILLTPKEGLSLQHLQEFELSNIPASIYDKANSRFFAEEAEINIIENTKLDKKDGDKKVSVSRFGNENIVFVDEGHRGASGDTWYLYRNQLCENGFSFEYSATFGQAVKAAKKNELIEEYAKCIIFDYSYKYFYKDGYGKDYRILNMEDDSDNHLKNLYLTACLMTYYQQKKLYFEKNTEISKFNLENPLFIFVGGSVNAVRKEKGKKISDVIDILYFFKEFVTEKEKYSAYILRILSGKTGIVDNKNRDIFRNSFPYLEEIDENFNFYNDILDLVFNCKIEGANLHIENLKGVQGEIRLRLGENLPFGVINVGDDTNLLKLCSENGFQTDTIDYMDSLFENINSKDSTINILIGSKKFTEGWSSWRVSTMGLMNVGKTEGSEIIQLFGRGVRLKGYDISLKRSSSLSTDYPNINIPKDINIIETLNIFGVRADYMKSFKDYLKEEGVDDSKNQQVILKLPVVKNRAIKNKNLFSLTLKNNLNYKQDAAKPIFGYKKNIPIITLDCYKQVQFESSKELGRSEITKNITTFKSYNTHFLNYDNIYFEIQKYKNEKSRYNVNIRKQDVIDLLNRNDWYRLYIPEEDLDLKSFNDYQRWEKIAITLLKKYFDKFYYSEKSQWETPLLTYTLIDENDSNFLKEDEYVISLDSENDNSEIVNFINKLEKQVLEAKSKNDIMDFIKIKNDLQITAFPSSLYSPLPYLAKNNLEISISPVALNESENKFIQDLKKYWESKKDTQNLELYIIRNKSKKGVGFFEDQGFYPDFIMWLLTPNKQYINFIDPHGARNMSISDGKVFLHKKIKELENKLNNEEIILNSIMVTPTKYSELVEKNIPKSQWEEKNVFFMEDESYIEKVFNVILS